MWEKNSRFHQKLLTYFSPQNLSKRNNDSVNNKKI